MSRSRCWGGRGSVSLVDRARDVPSNVHSPVRTADVTTCGAMWLAILRDTPDPHRALQIARRAVAADFGLEQLTRQRGRWPIDGVALMIRRQAELEAATAALARTTGTPDPGHDRRAQELEAIALSLGTSGDRSLATQH